MVCPDSLSSFLPLLTWVDTTNIRRQSTLFRYVTNNSSPGKRSLGVFNWTGVGTGKFCFSRRAQICRSFNPISSCRVCVWATERLPFTPPSQTTVTQYLLFSSLLGSIARHQISGYAQFWAGIAWFCCRSRNSAGALVAGEGGPHHNKQ